MGAYAVIAGKGRLAKMVIEAIGDPKIICFEGENDPEIKPDLLTRFGRVGQVMDFLRDNNIEKIVFAGVIKRPDVKNLSPDAEGAKLLAKILANKLFGKGLGDDRFLTVITKYLEGKGFKVVGVHEILKDLLAGRGIITKTAPNDDQLEDIKNGAIILRKTAKLDIGQAVIIEDGIALAIEATEGTAKMIERAGSLKKSYGGVLVKFKKLGQNDKADLPAIGVDTVRQIAAAGISGIAVEAGSTLIIDKENMIREADKAGVFIIGI
jgi:DUF1009 family protein